MKEIYWITRLDSLEGMFGLFVFLAILGAICYVIGKIAFNCYEMVCWLLEQGLIKKGDNDETRSKSHTTGL